MKRKVKTRPKPLLIIITIFFLLGIFVSVSWFYFTGPVDKGNKDDIEVVITSGMSTTQIGKMLKKKGLIRNEIVFKLYVKLNHVSSLKASKYILHKSMNLNKIVHSLEKGSNYNPDMIKLTFKEGLRITDYAKVIEKGTNHSSSEFLQIVNDFTYIKSFIIHLKDI